MPNLLAASIIARTLTCGSAMGPRSPHFGQVKTGEEMCLSDLIWRSMVSRESRRSTSAANDIVSRHSLRNLASISGNQTLWASPFGMEKIIPSSLYCTIPGLQQSETSRSSLNPGDSNPFSLFKPTARRGILSGWPPVDRLVVGEMIASTLQ